MRSSMRSEVARRLCSTMARLTVAALMNWGRAPRMVMSFMAYIRSGISIPRSDMAVRITFAVSADSVRRSVRTRSSASPRIE